jgi:hypothetical protein
MPTLVTLWYILAYGIAVVTMPFLWRSYKSVIIAAYGCGAATYALIVFMMSKMETVSTPTSTMLTPLPLTMTFIACSVIIFAICCCRYLKRATAPDGGEDWDDHTTYLDFKKVLEEINSQDLPALDGTDIVESGRTTVLTGYDDPHPWVVFSDNGNTSNLSTREERTQAMMPHMAKSPSGRLRSASMRAWRSEEGLVPVSFLKAPGVSRARAEAQAWRSLTRTQRLPTKEELFREYDRQHRTGELRLPEFAAA